MENIEIRTLIDITNTDVRRSNQGTAVEANQYRNWTTLKQCVELRALIEFDHNPTVETVDVKGLGFGSEYKGKHAVWTFRFRPDRPGAFGIENDPSALLNESLHQVPVIKNLTETINTGKAVFDLKDPSFRNTTIKII
jgi:hypothetical protein